MACYERWSSVFGLDPQRVAVALQVPVRRVRGWAAGRGSPSSPEWRDLAVLCGTSVPDLLECEDPDLPITTLAANEVPGKVDAYWGHVGLALTGINSCSWHPITVRTHEQLRNLINRDESTDVPSWMVIATLNNRVLVIPRDMIKAVVFRAQSFGANGPDNQASLPSPVPAEIYRALDERFHSGRDEYYANTSPRMQQQLDVLVQEWRLSDAHVRKRLLTMATVHFRDGSVSQAAVEHHSCAWSIADAEVLNNDWIVLGHDQQPLYVFRDSVRLIELPAHRHDANTRDAIRAAKV